MKKLSNIAVTVCLFSVIAWASLTWVVFLQGCSTTQQRDAFNSVFTVEHATSAAYDGYIESVIKGQTPTNDVPRISKAFNAFQASVLVALDAVQFNTNALAPASLIVESTDLIRLIESVSAATKGTK